MGYNTLSHKTKDEHVEKIKIDKHNRQHAKENDN